LADLRESASLEQDSDAVIGLFRPEHGIDSYGGIITIVYGQKKIGKRDAVGIAYDAEILVLKNRKGATVTIRLDWFPERTLFACCGETVFGDDGLVQGHEWEA